MLITAIIIFVLEVCSFGVLYFCVSYNKHHTEIIYKIFICHVVGHIVSAPFQSYNISLCGGVNKLVASATRRDATVGAPFNHICVCVFKVNYMWRRILNCAHAELTRALTHKRTHQPHIQHIRNCLRNC